MTDYDPNDIKDLEIGGVYDPDKERRKRVPGAYGWSDIHPESTPDGSSLRALRVSLSLTQQQCADLVRVSRPAWVRWENPEDANDISLTAWELFLRKTRKQRKVMVRKMKALQEYLRKG